MALMELKSNLAWYGSKPKTDVFENTDAAGFNTDKQLHESDYIGVSGTPGNMLYTHTGKQHLGQTKKYSDSFDNNHQSGFTPDRLPIGASRPDTEFKGIDNAGLYSSTSLFGQLVSGYAPIATKESTKFSYGSDLTVSAEIKGWDENGNWSTLRNMTTADGFSVDDNSFSNRGVSSRLSQMGQGSPFPTGPAGQVHTFDKVRTGFSPESRYGDIYGSKSNAGLADTYTTSSPIDDQYNKLNLRDDATPNHAWAKQPLILRGIQRAGKSDPQRWGLTGTPGLGGGFDIPRGGLLTSTTRALIDTARITKFLISPKGIGFLAKQFGYQLMNPNLENGAGVALGLFKTQTYNPLSAPTAALLQHVGIRPFRHGMPGLLKPLGGGGEYETNKKIQDATFGLGQIDSRLYLNRMNNLKTEAFHPQGIPGIGNAFKGGPFSVLTGIKGPGSLLGLGITTHRRHVDTGIAAQFGLNFADKSSYESTMYKYGTSAPGPLGDPLSYQNFKDNTGNGYTIEDVDTDVNKRSIYGTSPFNGGRELRNLSLRTAYENDMNFTQTDKLQSTIRNGEDKIYIGSAAGERTNIDWSTYEKREYSEEEKYQKGSTSEDLDGREGDGTKSSKEKISLAKRVDDPNFDGGGTAEGQSAEGTPLTGNKKYKTNNYNILKTTAESREGKTADHDYRGLDSGGDNPSDYNKDEATNNLVNLTKKKVSVDGNSSEGGETKDFDGGGTAEDAGFNPGSTVDDYKRMSYSQLPSRLPTKEPSIIDFRDIVGNTTNEGGKKKWTDTKLIDIDKSVDKSLINFSFSGNKFKAFLGTLSETFAPSWNGEQDQGRADPRMLYTSFERSIALDFIVPIFSEDHRTAIWGKLQKLAHRTMPVYGGAGFYGKTVSVTIGDMFKSKEMIITDLGFDWDAEAPWEITSGKQAPFYTNVAMSLTVLGTRPEYGQKLWKHF